jgi:hypothetical protein
VNFKGTLARSDDIVNLFSSRGPTRAAFVDGAGVRRVDNLLKPDLVAPGNKLVAAAATSAVSTNLAWNTLAASYWSALVDPLGIPPVYGETQMMLSGTSISAPAVAGTAGAHAAGLARAHPAADQGDPPIHRAAAAPTPICFSRARAC